MAKVEPQNTSMAAKAAWPLLLLTAALQAYDGLSSLAYLFMGVSSPRSGLGGWTVAATAALQSIAAVLACVMAARRDLRGATLAVAGCTKLAWFSRLPFIVEQGLDYLGDARIARAYFVASPVASIAAAALAWRNSYPILAALIVTAPTFAGLLFVIAFGIAIAMYGF